MIATIYDYLLSFVSLSWLTGPIFDKELRVSSRRRRNYFLRFAYVSFLTVFITFVWLFMVELENTSSSAVVRISRMSEAGKYIVTTIIWFQFIAIQFVSVVMLSTAISNEIYRRTLGVLMSTPVNSFQIVIGKFLSKLLQLILLLAISLPLLAVVRVLGGVSWDYIFSSLCITLTAVFFAGSNSLFFSIFDRRPHSVIMKVVSVCFLCYFGPYIILQLLQVMYPGVKVFKPFLYYFNPFFALGSATGIMLSASAAIPVTKWLAHCSIIFGSSVFLLVVSSIYVRKIGLQQAAGQAGLIGTWKERWKAQGKQKAVSESDSGQIRRIKGPLLVWKEMMNIYHKWNLKATVGMLLVGLVIFVAYAYFMYKQSFYEIEVHIGFVCVYFFLGLLQTSTSAANSITNEKEAQTWPVLLTVPLTNQQIAFGKILGSCMRGWFFWLCLFAHIVVFSITGYINPTAILPLLLLVTGSMFLVSSVGVFFSSCFKRSSISATVNMVLFLGFVLPFCCPSHFISPLFAAGIILGIAGDWKGISVPLQNTGSDLGSWLGHFLVSYLALIFLVVLYLLVAFVAFAFASSNIRRRIF